MIAAGQPFTPLSETENKHPDFDRRPTWEQWSTKDENVVFVPRQESGSVSVEQLRRPLKGKGRDLIQKAEKLIAKGKNAAAIAILEQAAEMPDAMPYAYSILGTEHLKSGQIDLAIRELEQAAAQLTGNAMIHNNLAFALGMQGQNERARKEADKALQIDPGNAKTRYIMGALLLSAGQREEALYHLRLAAEVIPGAAQLLHQELARTTAQEQKPSAAKEVPAGPAMSFRPAAK